MCTPCSERSISTYGFSNRSSRTLLRSWKCRGSITWLHTWNDTNHSTSNNSSACCPYSLRTQGRSKKSQRLASPVRKCFEDFSHATIWSCKVRSRKRAHILTCIHRIYEIYSFIIQNWYHTSPWRRFFNSGFAFSKALQDLAINQKELQRQESAASSGDRVEKSCTRLRDRLSVVLPPGIQKAPKKT